MIFREKRRIAISFVAATLVPIGVLAWFGLRVLQMDRDVEKQRASEFLQIAGQSLALEINARLEDVEDQLREGKGLQFTADGIRPYTELVTLYQPQAATDEDVPADLFLAIELDENQRKDYAAAASGYRRLAVSPKKAVRAAALAGLARVLHLMGDNIGAIQAYQDLEAHGALVIQGEPAALLARQGQLRILAATGAAAELRSKANALAADLDRAVYRIDRGIYAVYRDADEGLLTQWGVPPPSAEAIAGTEVAIRLWHQWQGGELPPKGQEVFRGDETQVPVLAVWTTTTDRPVVWIAAPDRLQAVLSPLAVARNLNMSLYGPDGLQILGGPQTVQTTLTPGETRLPFVLSVAAAVGAFQGTNMRQAVLIGGLLVAFLVIVAAVYSLYRSTTRELYLAQLQSDFVSAVSHEFRTPLTSLRHLSDLLSSRGITSEERKAQYYKLIGHETERLHRMVESLLSFGRMEANAYPWRLERINAAEVLRTITEEFRAEPLATDREILCDIEEPLAAVLADKEALSRALWNLLENAAKYSDQDQPIRAFARSRNGCVLLGVEDKGPGIPEADQKRIFEKFARGAGARREGIRGVGIGLALVRRIVEAHHGRVQLESQPGKGSTFTIMLPEIPS